MGVAELEVGFGSDLLVDVTMQLKNSSGFETILSIFAISVPIIQITQQIFVIFDFIDGRQENQYLTFIK